MNAFEKVANLIDHGYSVQDALRKTKSPVSACVRFDGKGTPIVITTNEGGLTVADAGIGLYEVIVPPVIDLDKAAYIASSEQSTYNTAVLRLSSVKLRISIRNDAGGYTDASDVNVIIFGGDGA